ncbi:cell division protein FtsZ [Parvibaculum sp.]|uniref:cell division protein FtsZ n=1 Tax=Parvibaculum sp. TaxID=2024848 RepID=UPI001B181ED2|nr:cell division protein FtsZ [Parvibaculum sp.]MBO6633271.1 cell division protein FtsZ [Parvibaculum sp.]MBO6679748.1 cell division protein FtsZ [Parvibaculum sp.]MBO6683591.1 cell division protein FtsZ [Parvibaculum sp.]
MSIKLSVPQSQELKPRITVFGVGGAGGNAVNNMIEAGLEGVDFVVANTDAQALSLSSAERRIQLGASITEGLGAGSRPEVGCAAAEEALNEIVEHLQGAHMVFITAGMGGGTGTGAAPVIARAAREHGILTVGVVTKPFQFEGSRRMRLAEEGIRDLHQYVDTLIIIPNQNLFRVANENTTFADAFGMADQVLHSGVAGITDLMMKPGLINLDFADVRTVMNEMGKAMMGTGEASGENRAIEAAEAAISNPLLDEVSMKGAKGVLINITGGMDLTLYEVDEAANRIRSEVDPDANIIVGSTFDTSLDGRMRVSVVATGIEVEEGQQPRSETQAPQLRAIAAERPAARAAAQASAPAQAHASSPANPVQAQVERIEERMTPASTQAELGIEAEERAPAPRASGQFDPKDYEAEVIIHKPEQRQQPAREPEAPVVAASAVRAEPKAPRPYIPGDLDRVQTGKSDLPSFLGQKAQPVQQSRAPKKGPTFFERLTGGRRKEAEEEQPAPQSRREPTVAHRPRPERSAQSEQARAPESLSPSTESRLVQPSHEEEQLEIPTFLRRQAN